MSDCQQIWFMPVRKEICYYCNAKVRQVVCFSKYASRYITVSDVEKCGPGWLKTGLDRLTRLRLGLFS